MTMTVFIRYQLDPFKREQFEAYAKRWLTIIPACGGNCLGYWMPHEGTNNIAFGLISFDSLAAYETYRTRLKADDAGKANFQFAEHSQFILPKNARSCGRWSRGASVTREPEIWQYYSRRFQIAGFRVRLLRKRPGRRINPDKIWQGAALVERWGDRP